MIGSRGSNHPITIGPWGPVAGGSNHTATPFPNLFSLKSTLIHTERLYHIPYTIPGCAEIIVIVAHYRLDYHGLNLDIDFTQN